MTTDEKIAEIKIAVDHRKLHPQNVHEAFYVLFNEIERLRSLKVESSRFDPKPQGTGYGVSDS